MAVAVTAAPTMALTVETQSSTSDGPPAFRPVDRRPVGGARADEERDIALAATWHVDPVLLRPHPTDSLATAAAREELASIDARLRELLAAYDAARTTALRAADSARQARVDLRAARAAHRAAEQRFRADRDLLVSVLTEDYTTAQLGPLALVLTADSDQDLLTGLSMLEEMGGIQTDAVEAADRSRERLRVATLAVAAAETAAQDRLEAARASLAEADEARHVVLDDVQEARSLVAGSVLADRTARDAVAGGYLGAIRFPLAPGTSFVDLDNFGHRSRHWASVHTGDDLATGCGSAVVAATDGTVLVRTDQGWSGPWLVMVSTGEGSLTTWYAHMQAVDVVAGQQVRAGDQLGLVGQRGNATGCHLHFEVHPSGGTIYADDTDPAAWLHAVGAYPDG